MRLLTGERFCGEQRLEAMSESMDSFVTKLSTPVEGSEDVEQLDELGESRSAETDLTNSRGQFTHTQKIRNNDLIP